MISGVGYMRREYSMVKPLNSGSTQQYWQLQGSAIVTDEHLRLTSDEQSKAGSVWGKENCCSFTPMMRLFEVFYN